MKLMKIKSAITIALLMLSLSASAEFTTISRAYEIPLSDLRVPSTLNGGVSFRQCAECEAQTVRVTPATQYLINGQPVTLKEFRKSIFRIHRRADKTVTVLHHLESNTVATVSVTL